MFIKRARPRPSARARTREAEDEDPAVGSPLAQPSASMASDGAADEEEAGSVLNRAKAKKKGMKGKGGRLSFAGDDESGESSTAFKQKKSLLSQALRASTPIASSPGAAAAASPQSYSADYLSELKAATPTRAPTAEESGSGHVSLAAREKYATEIDADSAAGIPDPAAIAAAKNRRKAAVHARRHGIEPGEDYISLGKEPHPESRLMREEDEGEEGDEGLADYTGVNDRLYLGKSANKRAAQRLKGEIGELIEDREMDSESDEETREWERTLVERGGVQPAPVRLPKEKVKTAGYIPTPIPASRPVPTIGSATARIAERMAALKATKDENERNLENATRELVLLEEQERDIRKQVESTEGKRAWVEEFQGWVETLGLFLEEKVPLLDTIEKDANSFARERAERITARRAGDDSDDLALVLGVAPTQTRPEEQSANESAPNSESRKMRRQAHADRRARRRGIVAAPDEDGFSTDDDLDESLSDDYDAAQREVERRVHALLEDVKAEDLRDPELGVAVRFADWRKRYPEEYEGAFGGLSLVQAWEFWARGEMVGWDPVRSDTTLDSFGWYRALYGYSRPRVDVDDDDAMDLEPEVAPEGDLSVEMVSKVVVPYLIRAVEETYDPYSARQTRRLRDVVDFVGMLLGEDHRKYQALVRAVSDIFTSTITTLAQAVAGAAGPMATRAPPYNPAARNAMRRFVRRRIKLISNLAQWRRLAPDVTDLIARVVSLTLRPILAKTWAEGGGDEMGAKVLAMAQGLPPNLVQFLQSGR
ncbi:hypothetical protein CC85DRAFT_261824 [Cutaneotrichosporon oleaginosum]|uniref:GCFC-domain-containing protein n=1 Tax=Cutaneotrichosporon oleaginosum TaxID=879819 RepID=A0A0J1B1Q9_9TREE|nr:uncharacterized protein CC85DRAFT_261824 [Cutaneotrichosporon oleaginosum]KLT41564.1 hypothetical protein CC85DRAFT_261824 [Cutaneotrichosporon oleaginosum]TXT09330.1 hypothetical protein COLE_03264 [Cutaneotrichosporon oleaginosum]